MRKSTHRRQSVVPFLASLLVFAGPAACQQEIEGPLDPSDRAPVAEGYAFEPVISGLDRPWSVAWLPNGDMLITERKGQLRIVRNGTLDPRPIRDLPEIGAFGQGGLMEVSLHPEFEDNQLVYLAYTEGDRNANRTVLGRGKLLYDRIERFEVIFRVDETKSGGQHFGARVVWLPDNTLLLSIGDGGNPPAKYGDTFIRNLAQDPDADVGKVHRLNDDGSAPDDNPFVGRDDADPTVYSYGHRNIQGMDRDPVSGRIYANEHGARGGDELNIIEPGVNYGWPKATYSREYWGPRISEETS
ncbi:MAG: PQQ-dependent sugar dehydrogenase, partial [Planctomycetota bacterium]